MENKFSLQIMLNTLSSINICCICDIHWKTEYSQEFVTRKTFYRHEDADDETSITPKNVLIAHLIHVRIERSSINLTIKLIKEFIQEFH